MSKVLSTTTLGALASFAAVGALADSSTFEGEARDAWITGKIEGAYVLNGYLNPFAIDTDVQNGVVHLHYSIYPNGNYNAGIDPWPHLYAVEWHVCD